MNFSQDAPLSISQSANYSRNIQSFQLHVFYHFLDYNSLFLLYNFQTFFFGESFCGTDSVNRYFAVS